MLPDEVKYPEVANLAQQVGDVLWNVLYHHDMKFFCFLFLAYGDLIGMNSVEHVGDWRYLYDGHLKHTPEPVEPTSGQRGGTPSR